MNKKNDNVTSKKKLNEDKKSFLGISGRYIERPVSSQKYREQCKRVYEILKENDFVIIPPDP